MSLRRVSDIFNHIGTNPILVAQTAESPSLQDNDQMMVNSLNKKRMAVDTSQESTGNKSQDNMTPRRLRPSSLRGNPIRVRKALLPDSMAGFTHADTGRSKAGIVAGATKIDWKYVDNLDVGCEENNHIDNLVRDCLFSKKKNAFNMSEKTKLFVTLRKKTDQVTSVVKSLNIKDTIKEEGQGSGFPGSHISISSAANHQKEIMSTDTLRQQYLAKLNGKGIGEQMIKTREPRTRIHLPIKPTLGFRDQLRSSLRDPKLLNTKIPEEPISMRIRLSDRLNILKTKGSLPKAAPPTQVVDREKLLK